MKRNILKLKLSLLLFALLSALCSNAQTYGYVGDYIYLSKPSIPYGATDKGFSFNTKASELYVSPSSGTVQILKYFSGTRTVTCDYYYLAEVGHDAYGTPIVNPFNRSMDFEIACNPIYLSGIPSNLTLEVGQVYPINWSSSPYRSTVRTEWSSSNTSVVTVNSSGTLTAKGAGSATITVENNSGPDKSFSVTVTGDPKVELTAWPSEGVISAGSYVYLNTPNVSDADIYYTLDGSTPTKNSTKYTSSGITINKSCTLKAIAYKNGYEDSAILTVAYTIKETPVVPTSIDVSPSSKTINVGGTFTATYSLTPSNATTTVTWTSDDSSIASVDNNGKVTGKKAGSTYINAKTSNGKTDWCKVTVEGNTPSTKLELTVSPSGGQVSAGTTVTLTAKANGSTVSSCDIYYTTNGTTPSKSNGTKYTSSGIIINESCTLKTIAYKDGYETSTVLTTTYTVLDNNENRVAAGREHTLIVKKDGTLWGCGDNYNGQLGDGTTTYRSTPVKIMDGVASVAAGERSTYIVKQDGSLWAFGFNNFGQLGIGATAKTNSLTPVKVMDGVASVAAGGHQTLIVKQDGTLWACGRNYWGQLGDGTSTDRYSPVKIMNDVVSVAASGGSSHIVKKDGTLWACGYNQDGKLGDGTSTAKYSPVKIMNDVISVAANLACLIVKRDGTLWGCGDNYNGQLGDGTTTDRYTPVKIMDGVASVATGERSTYIVKQDGSLWTCGNNNYGQLGDGTTTDRHTPVKIMDDVVSVAAGDHHALFVKQDGTLWACGLNNSGQLGDGTTTNRPTPVMIMDTSSTEQTGISFPSSITIKVGETVLLTPKVYPEGVETTLSGSFGNNGVISATSYNNKTQFLISGLKEGTSYQEVRTDNGLSARCEITVSGYNPTAKGDGTRENPYNAVGAFIYAASLPTNVESEKNVYIKGKVLAFVEEFGTKYGNATFYISDDGTINNEFMVYRTNYLNNKKFAEGDTPLKVGDEVLIYGKVVNYSNGTNRFVPETSQNNSYIVSINGKGAQQNVSVSSAGYATFYSSNSAYTLPNGLSAQVVTSVANGKLTYKTIADGSVSGIVPKGTAVMLVSDAKRAGTYMLSPTESTTTYSGSNLLRGSDDATMTSGDGYHYKLSYGRSGSSLNNVFGWYWGAANGGSFQIDGHKAWLVVPKSSATRGYSIGDEATGITDVEADDADVHYYDLQGRSVSKPQRKGVYIKNGQRVIIK